MKPVLGERYEYVRLGSVWDGVILECTRSLIHGLPKFTVIQSPPHFIIAGGRIGGEYPLGDKFLKPVEPEYLQYDPCQQEDLDSDI